MKKVISAAAAITLLSTGAFAFDANTNGQIVTHTTCSNTGVPSNWIPSAGSIKVAAYTGGVEATGADAAAGITNGEMKKSLTTQGDALIFPAFNQKDGAATEIVFRNMQRNRGLVAKVVLYSADNSRELRDFNVYLSENDAFRFMIKDGKLTTKDESFMKTAKQPYYAGFNPATPSIKDSATPVKTGEETTIASLPVSEAGAGYVVVYAMASAQNLTAGKDAGYHYDGGHVDLFKDYRIALDNTRTGWRKPYSKLSSNFNPVCNGVISFNHPTDANIIAAPNVNPTITKANDFTFTDPDSSVLSGTVSMMLTGSGSESDMVIPATAIQNFTMGNILLWTEGEYASLQDRRIAGGVYNTRGIVTDTTDFLVSGALYSFKANSANNLMFTQPYKRILVQLGQTTYWDQYSSAHPYGGFRTSSVLYDEAEGQPATAQNPEAEEEAIISPVSIKPGSPDPVRRVWEELAVFSDEDDLQRQDNKADDMTNPSKFFVGKNGFGYTNIVNDNNGRIPAIVSQQMGSIVEGTNQMNWIYVPKQ